jgi:hypothetical protein
MGIFDRLRGKKTTYVNKNNPSPTGKEYKVGANFKFYNTTYDGILRKGDSVQLFWPYANGMGPDDIVEIKPGCQCTAEINWNDKGVYARFTNQEKDEDLAKGDFIASKAMTVVFNDRFGKINNTKGKMVWHPNKFTEVLKFSGIVAAKKA